MTRTAFLFPGQGSQYVGMGQDFSETWSWARDIFALADDITGKPITSLCFNGPLEELTLTVNLQPAITAVNLVCFKALVDQGIKPQAAAGHSLGEYSALAAAGVISIEDALKLVNIRGELMQREANKKPGAMQAVIGLDIEKLTAITAMAGKRGVVVVANHNTAEQIVITGEAEAVAEAGEMARAEGARAVPLNVSGAWHSPLMAAAAEEFTETIQAVKFSAPSCQVYLNVTGAVEADPDKIKAIMTRQIVSPVKWHDTIKNMLAQDVDSFIEVGPGKVLAGLNRKNVPKESPARTLNIQDKPGLDKIAAG